MKSDVCLPFPPRRVVIGTSDAVGWYAVRATLQESCLALVVKTTGSLSELMDYCRSCPPDAIVADWRIGGLTIFPALRRLRPYVPHTTFVVIGESYDAGELLILGDAGISSYLLWDDLNGPRLRAFLDAAILGDTTVVSSAVAAAYVAAQRSPHSTASAISVSDRERAVLRLLGEGLTQAHIARELGVSVRTVEAVISRLKTKLDAINEFTLAVQAFRHGLIP